MRELSPKSILKRTFLKVQPDKSSIISKLNEQGKGTRKEKNQLDRLVYELCELIEAEIKIAEGK